MTAHNSKMIPNESHDVETFSSYAAFVQQLWNEATEDMRGDCTTPYTYARCCSLSENGVFDVVYNRDGSVTVRYVG